MHRSTEFRVRTTSYAKHQKFLKNNFKNCLSKMGCLPIIRLPAAGNVFHGNNDSKKISLKVLTDRKDDVR
jgi:hypothetical protein